MHKMSWLEFRRHPKSDWMPGALAKNARQSVGMPLTSFVSNLLNVSKLIRFGSFACGKSPQPCRRIPLMQKIELSCRELCGETLSEVL